MNLIFTHICEGLRLGLKDDKLLEYVQARTTCTVEQFKSAYSVILEAYLK